MMTGVRAIVAMRGARFGIRVASGVLALMVVAAGGIAVWYRQAWNVWPGQGPLVACTGAGGATSPLRPAADLAAHHLAGAGPSPCRGRYPPLGWSRQECPRASTRRTDCTWICARPT
jgi:hypothetical protein